MMQKQATKGKRKVTWRRGPTKYPGIAEHAKVLGIQRSTLYRYLEGIWDFPEETRIRYEHLLASEAEEASK